MSHTRTRTIAGNLLVYHGKHGDHYWLVDTPERYDAALKAMFDFMDEMGYYRDAGARNNAILAAARGGDMQYIKGIVESHNGYEYESWDIETAADATEEE